MVDSKHIEQSPPAAGRSTRIANDRLGRLEQTGYRAGAVPVSISKL
jgi:hypothetical protein